MPHSLEVLEPGSVIEFAEITQLKAFEDLVAVIIEPDLTPTDMEHWVKGRLALQNLIRPPTFNGTIADIRLQVMEEPYARLVDARERGWQLPGGGKYALSGPLSDELISRYHGFVFTANAMSTRKGFVGEIQTELWYYPINHFIRARNLAQASAISNKTNLIAKNSGSNAGLPVRRAVAKPKIETQKFLALHESSKKIGFAVLRQAMAHPLIQPMRQ